MVRRPRPPKAYYELQDLNDRWGQAVDWYDSEVGAAYAYRTFAFRSSMFISSHKARSEVQVRICERLEERLKELDECQETFKEAHEHARTFIDSDSLLDYSVKIMPIVQKETRELQKKRMQEMLEKKGKKHASGHRNKRVSKAYRKEETPVKRAGDRAVEDH